MGNLLMDYIVELDDSSLIKFNLKKGICTLIDEKDLLKLKQELKDQIMIKTPGGSTANVLHTFSILGQKATLFGAVGKDEVGEEYFDLTSSNNLTPLFSKSQKHTGTAITIITPDKERSFAVYLGAAIDINLVDLDLDALKKSKYLFVGGHELVDNRINKIYLKALDIAKENKVKICIDLADPFVVEQNKDFLKKIVSEYASILFANKEEAQLLTSKKSDEAIIKELSTLADVSIYKLGEEGSIIVNKGIFHKIKPFKVKVKDTTGAGDSYAGAFLYGVSKNLSIQKSGELASFISSKIVSQIGARFKNKPEIQNIIGEK